MAIPTLNGDHLPEGRWVCTPDEVATAFVPEDPTDIRHQIWSEWLSLTKAVQDLTGQIAACWLSGSFFTTKPDPSDIDCLYVIDADRLDVVRRDPDQRKAWFLQLASTGQIKGNFPLRVDSYILEWVPTPGSDAPAHAHGYLSMRGYWDDLWVRIKDADQRLEAIPRRGYLEVILDGYR